MKHLAPFTLFNLFLIFLHCFSGKYEYTTGCISISEENMIQVMQLLQSDCVIIIDKKENILQY